LSTTQSLRDVSRQNPEIRSRDYEVVGDFLARLDPDNGELETQALRLVRICSSLRASAGRKTWSYRHATPGYIPGMRQHYKIAVLLLPLFPGRAERHCLELHGLNLRVAWVPEAEFLDLAAQGIFVCNRHAGLIRGDWHKAEISLGQAWWKASHERNRVGNANTDDLPGLGDGFQFVHDLRGKEASRKHDGDSNCGDPTCDKEG